MADSASRFENIEMYSAYNWWNKSHAAKTRITYSAHTTHKHKLNNNTKA